MREIDAYNASCTGAHPPEDCTDETEGGWAVTTEEAVAAAASGARKVAAGVSARVSFIRTPRFYHKTKTRLLNVLRCLKATSRSRNECEWVGPWVAAALGREQENAALYALLQACPNSTLLETGLIPLDRRSSELRAWGFRAGDLPAMGASPDGILIFPLPDEDKDEDDAGCEGEGNTGAGDGGSSMLSRLFSPGSFARRGSGERKKKKTLSAVEMDIARAVLAGVAAAAKRDDDGGGGGGGGKKKNNSNNKKRFANAKKKNKKKKKSSSTAAAAAADLDNDNGDKKQPHASSSASAAPPWGAAVPAGYAAVVGLYVL